MSSTDCKLTLPDGTHYDLTSLSNSKQDYETVAGNQTYHLNVCRSVVSELWKIEEADNVGAYTTRAHGDFSIGSTNSTLMLSPMTNEPVIILSNGSPCPSNPSSSASSVIHFICDPTIFGSGKPELVAALPPGPAEDQCAFFFDWKTHVACPTSERKSWVTLSPGHYIGVLFALVVIALIAYLLFHTLYNRFVLGYRGWDQVPHPSLPSLRLPSMNLFGREPRSAPSWGSWRRGGYGHVGAVDPDDDEEHGFAGRFSLEDDEVDQDARALAGDPSVWRDVGRNGQAPNGQPGHQRTGSDPLLDL